MKKAWIFVLLTMCAVHSYAGFFGSNEVVVAKLRFERENGTVGLGQLRASQIQKTAERLILMDPYFLTAADYSHYGSKIYIASDKKIITTFCNKLGYKYGDMGDIEDGEKLMAIYNGASDFVQIIQNPGSQYVNGLVCKNSPITIGDLSDASKSGAGFEDMDL